MNTTQLKSYAPAARRAFIAAVTAQAARLGITAKEIAPATVQGDVLLVNGQPFPRSAESGRTGLIRRVKAQGFEATMDAVAYTWFNRLVAIRYMELHNYLEHGYRVLSNPDGSGRPEILDKAAEVELPGLDRAKAVQLKLDGTRDEELYRLLLIAQCNALHRAMPFLFEKLGDETELLLPANLLHTDSLIRQLVDSIDESAWQQIEIIGWLYQFYISEKKDQVIGKVVRSEDIPAATQLFTPNWIVKYMVQNSLGAQWLATYPSSPLKAQMEYYIEPAEQTEDVKAQLAVINPASLNPEEITLIDPACGSGHILVEAYDLFKAIYVERGYRERDAAQLILTKNLHGLDIDPRAAQLSGFALMMKGRADDRRLFERGIKLNVMALINSEDLDIAALTHGVELAEFGLHQSDLRELKKLFEHATTFGSLIQVPESLTSKLPTLQRLIETTVGEVRGLAGDMFAAGALEVLALLVKQATTLASLYDCVVANPPYMGSKGMNGQLKALVKEHFIDARGDLFACFLERGRTLSKRAGYIAMITMETWMFLSGYESLRSKLAAQNTLRTLAHFPYDGKRPTVMGINFGVSAVTLLSRHIDGFSGHYCCSRHFELNDDGVPRQFPTPNERLISCATHNFAKIPGRPIAYWVSERVRRVFQETKAVRDMAVAKPGLCTGRDEEFLREWHEVSVDRIGFGLESRESAARSGRTWFPFNKGGPFRRWWGNQNLVVNWKNDGQALHAFARADGKGTRIQNIGYYFQPGITWNQTGSSLPSFRYVPQGFIPAHIGAMAFPTSEKEGKILLGFLNSSVARTLLNIISPTMGLEVGHVSSLPIRNSDVLEHVNQLQLISQSDWSSQEISWDFQRISMLKDGLVGGSLGARYREWITICRQAVCTMHRLEEKNNAVFVDLYELNGELETEVPLEQVSLWVNPAYRYGVKITEEERETRFREDAMQELVSYAVGSMMGRYSLEDPGLIYAHSSNVGFDPSRFTKFPADDDGIIPVTDAPWFEDDAATRLEEFLSVALDSAHLEENLTFLADNLSPNKNETSRDTLRRYLCDKFFKDHLQTYKNRPIYWLFTSGKQKAFQCLVYLHRYNEGTLARMRSEYVIPLQGKMAARLSHLADDRKVASPAQQKRLDKESVKLTKQQAELREFDEKLRHYADRRISLDLDDGVKVNYGKFGSLLAEVEKIHGQKAEGP
jgi:hypothetical protein